MNGNNNVGSVKTMNLVLDMVRSGSSVEESKEDDKVNLPDNVEIKYDNILKERKGEKKLIGTQKSS